jgi:putative transposase
MAEEPVAERGVLTAPTQMWETAVRQAEVIGPLAAKDTVGLAEADEAPAAAGRPASGECPAWGVARR